MCTRNTFSPVKNAMFKTTYSTNTLQLEDASILNNNTLSKPNQLNPNTINIASNINYPKILMGSSNKDQDFYDININNIKLLYLLCPICRNIPNLELATNSPLEIDINCSYCYFRKKEKLKTYLMKILPKLQESNSKCERYPDHNQRKAIGYCKKCSLKLCEECAFSKNHSEHVIDYKFNRPEYYCSEHKKQEFILFCANCNMHFCSLCDVSTHAEHNLISLKNEQYYINKELIVNELNETKNFIDNTCFSIKENYIDAMNKFISENKNNKNIKNLFSKLITKLNESYRVFLDKNYLLIYYIQLLLDNYNEFTPNYFQISNLFNVLHIKHVKIESILGVQCLNLLPSFENINKDNNKLESTHSNNIEDINKLINFFNTNLIRVDKAEIALCLIKEKKIIDEHSKIISKMMLLKDKRIATCCYDKTIKIFDTQLYLCQLILVGHNDKIFTMCQLENNLIASSSADGIIILWMINKNTYGIAGTINAHDCSLYDIIDLDQNYFAACSLNGFISIYECICPFNLHKKIEDESIGKIFKMLKISKNIILNCGDKGVSFLDVDKYKKIFQINNIKMDIGNGLIKYEDKIILGENKRMIIINIHNYQIEKIISEQNLGIVKCFTILRDNSMLVGSSNGYIFHFDPVNYIIKDKKKIHEKDIVGMVSISDSFIVTCSDDFYMKIFEL